LIVIPPLHIFFFSQNYFAHYPILHPIPTDLEHTSNATSPEDPYVTYQSAPQK